MPADLTVDQILSRSLKERAKEAYERQREEQVSTAWVAACELMETCLDVALPSDIDVRLSLEGREARFTYDGMAFLVRFTPNSGEWTLIYLADGAKSQFMIASLADLGRRLD